MQFIRRRHAEIVFLCSIVLSVFWLKGALLASPPIPELYPHSDPPRAVLRVAEQPTTVAPPKSPIRASAKDPNLVCSTADSPSEELTQDLTAVREEVLTRFVNQCARNSFSALDFKYADIWLRVVLSDSQARDSLRTYLFGISQTHPEFSGQILSQAMGAIARTDSGYFRSVLEDAISLNRWDVASAAINFAYVAGMDDEGFLAMAKKVAGNSYAGQYNVFSAINNQYKKSADIPDILNGFRTGFLQEVSADLGALQLANFEAKPFTSRGEWVSYIENVSDIAATTDDIGRAHLAGVQIQMSSYRGSKLDTIEWMRDRGETTIAGIAAMVASPWPLLQYIGSLEFEQVHEELLLYSIGERPDTEK